MECAICYEETGLPMDCCSEFVCEDCRYEIHNKCPVCRGTIDLMAERLRGEIDIECMKIYILYEEKVYRNENTREVGLANEGIDDIYDKLFQRLDDAWGVIDKGTWHAYLKDHLFELVEFTDDGKLVPVDFDFESDYDSELE